MRLSRAIEIYKSKCQQAINGEIEYKKIHPGCKCCVSGVDFGVVKFDSGDIYLKNGYRFKLSCDLGNSLERLFQPLLSRPLGNVQNK